MKILVAGAGGTIGFELVKQLSAQGHHVRALYHREPQREPLLPFTTDVRQVELEKAEMLAGCCADIDVVINAAGKSLSFFRFDGQNFDEVDYEGKKNLLREAEAAGVKRFINTSVFYGEEAHRFALAEAQEKFETVLEASPLSGTMVRLVGMFHALEDWITMAKVGVIPVPGNGSYTTNSVHQADVARAIIDVLEDGPDEIFVGGPEVHTRNQQAKLIAKYYKALVLNIPAWLMIAAANTIGLFNRGIGSKIRFYTYVCTHHMVAPQMGTHTFEAYLKKLKADEEKK